MGFFDHHAGEIFFQTLAVLTFLAAFAVAEREAPVWELLLDRDWDALKKPAAYAVAAGGSLGLYMWTWQPGVLMVGFTGIFVAVKITSDVYHGRTPEPIAFAAAVSMTVAGLMQLIPLDDFSFGVTDYSLTQVILPLGVGLGAVFLAWLARQWEARDLEVGTYPPAVGGLIVASMGLVWLALPSLWSTLSGNLLRRIGFSTQATDQTIGEAAPPLQGSAFADFVLSQYGLAFFLALFAVLVIMARPLWRSDDGTHTIYGGVALAVIGSVYALPGLYDAIDGIVGVNWQVIGLLIATAFLVAVARLGQLVEPLFGAIAVLGVAHIDPPPIQPDRVDGTAGLDEQIDRVGKLVLAAVGGLHEVTRVEDRGRKVVEAGHHEVTRRVVGLLDDLGDLAVLVGVEDAVSARLLVGDLFDEERGVGAIFLLAVGDI